MTLQSVASTSPQSGVGTPGGAGILQTQLSRYETQLADWCNCPGGKTPEGKKIITDLQQKADAARMEIKRIDDARARGKDSAPSATGVQGAPRQSLSSPLGLRLDVYA